MSVMITVRVDEQTREAIKQAAREAESSLNQFCVKALAEAVVKHEVEKETK
jgi:predicted HicB family RNase H-like nuclease